MLAGGGEGKGRGGAGGGGGRSCTAPTLKGRRNEGRCLLCQYNYTNVKHFSDRFVCKFRMASVYQCHYATEAFFRVLNLSPEVCSLSMKSRNRLVHKRLWHFRHTGRPC